MRRYAILAMLGIALIMWVPAAAQDFQIVAVVNGEPVSNHALYRRVMMVARSAQIGEEERTSLSRQTLRAMVHEILQKQEAERLELTLSEKEIHAAVAQLEKKNGLAPGEFETFLAKQGTPKDAVFDQIRTQLLWNKIITRRIQPGIVVTDYEVQDTLTWLARQKNPSEVRLSVIFLPVETKEEDAPTKKLAETLVKKLRDGAKFSELVQQFTPGSSNTDGEIGWVQEENLDKEVREALAKVGKNSIAGPVPGKNGYRIFRVEDRRTLSAKDITPEKVRHMLLIRKIDLETKRYLKSLVDGAYIEMKL